MKQMSKYYYRLLYIYRKLFIKKKGNRINGTRKITNDSRDIISKGNK